MSFIQNLFTSRDNNANGASYVGQQDRIWWNPDTNAFYYSNGNTPGGIPIGAGGAGSPGGPVSSIQYNLGGGTFGGTANLVISGTGLSAVGNISTATFFIGDGSQLANLPIQPGTYSNTNVASFLTTYTGNITAGNILTDNYLYANGDSIFANVAFTGNVNLGNLYIVDQTIGGTNINGNITLAPEGSGWVDVPKLAIATSNISIVAGKLQFATPAGVDIQLAPGTGGNILTGGTIKPTGNNLAGLGAIGSRYTDLWLGSGNINLIDQTLNQNQQIYADNGNLILGNATGLSFGNFRFYGNVMALANAAANIEIGTSNATGYVNFNRAIAVIPAGGAGDPKVFEVARDGRTKIYAPDSIPLSDAALQIIGSSSGNSQPRNFTATMIQVTGQDNQPTRITFDAFGASGAQNAYAVMAARAARGTVDSPQPIQSNDILFRLSSQGWTGNNAYASGIARLSFSAAETFTSNAAVGTTANIQLTPIGSNVIKTITGFSANGVSFPSSGAGGTGNLGITFQDGSFQNTAFIASNSVSSITVTDGLQQSGPAPQSGAVTIDNLGVLRATGTPQQIRINGSYTTSQTGNIVLALPQDIATNSTVTFGNVTITGNLNVVGNTISGNTIGFEGKLLYLANNSSANTDINFGGIALGNVDQSYSRTILYDLNNNRWTTAGQANSSGISNFYTPVSYSANVVTDYLDVTYTGHFGTAYDGDDFPSAEIQAYSDINGFGQIVNWNKNSGSGASADFVAVNNLGNTTNEIYFIDLGINSSTYANADYAVSGPNDGYLFINGGNLIIGTQNAGNVIKFHTGGTGNVNNIRATLSDTGLSLTGNVTANNFVGNAVFTTNGISATGTITGGNVYSLNNINAVGSVTAQTLIANTTISATGTITGGNLRTAAGGFISTTGNVIAGNVVTATTTIDGGVSTTGNVTGGNIIASGTISAIGNISTPNLNASIAIVSTLLSITGNIDGGNLRTSGIISTTGNATFGNVQTTGVISSTGNIDAGNLRTSGIVLGTTLSATGAVRAASTVGGVITGSSVSVTGAVSGASASVSGGVTAASVAGGVITGTSTSVTGTQTAASTVGGVITGSSLSTTGNVTTAGYFLGDGGLLSNITAVAPTKIVNGTSWANIAASGGNLVMAIAGNTIGTISAGGANITGYANVSGNVTGGNLVGQNLTAGRVAIVGSGKEVSDDAEFTYNSSTNVLSVGGNILSGGIISTSGNITGNYILGNIANATGGPSAQIVSTYTPTLEASGGGTFTYTSQIGNYVKSGRNVSIFFTIGISGVTGVSGTVRVANLPFQGATVSGSCGGGALDSYSFTVMPIHVTGTVGSGSSHMDLQWHDRSGSTNTLAAMTTGQLGTTATLTGRITYISAS